MQKLLNFKYKNSATRHRPVLKAVNGFERTEAKDMGKSKKWQHVRGFQGHGNENITTRAAHSGTKSMSVSRI